MSGKLEKLTILSHELSELDESDGTYVALINPDQLVTETSIKFEEKTTKGNKTKQQNFTGTNAPKVSIKFLFDGTGIINQDNHEISFSLSGGIQTQGSLFGKKPNGGTVDEQIIAFKDVTLKYNKNTHEPKYVTLVYGGWIFEGRLSTLKITYTLFSKEGLALRATGDATFVESVPTALEAKDKDNKSPDLTHVRTVKEGDTLHLMCQTIYKNPKLYLEIARVNKLSNYRKLAVGEKLFFPPIKELN
ncbi:MAG: hypothetical protein ACI8ZM_002267 [Crocinitomix sp.]|jgi:hypothetical protein